MKSTMQKTSLFFSLLFAFACNNNESKQISTADTIKTEEVKVMIPQQTCYIGSLGQDTVTLKIERFPNVVTGLLEYRFNEKDHNKGEFEGKLKGDTLVADYTFSSEGTKSVRQVIFLLQDDTAIEGYGEMEEKNGKLVFKNLNEIKFDGILKLYRTECNY